MCNNNENNNNGYIMDFFLITLVIVFVNNLQLLSYITKTNKNN